MTLLLFVVIFIEGYVVLASELIAIRLIVPWVGSGTEIISIVIAAVLMPLAFGYHFGGQYKKNCKKKGLVTYSIRKKLLSNIKTSVVILSLGLSYIILDVFFIKLYDSGIVNRLAQALIYVSIFIIYPVFLLGQTIPLISNYFSKKSLSEMTGKMLMLSTLGSFFGSIFSTVILMSFIGVHYTVIFVIVLLCILVLLINKRGGYDNILFVIFIAGITFYLNSETQMKNLGIVNNNAYNTVQILKLKDDKDARVMALNRNYSSSYKDEVGSTYIYIRYINKVFIEPLQAPIPPKSILVIGAAGFTIGLNDTYNDYTFIDIDPDLLKVAENDFLKQKLSDNKKFIPIPARGFLSQVEQAGKGFDLIILDTFKAGFSMPEHLLTHEYFKQVKRVLNPNGYIVINAVASTKFSGRFSKRLDNTIRSVFPYVSRSPMKGYDDNYNAWEVGQNDQDYYTTNIIYSYYKGSEIDNDMTIYTDNKNTYFLDK